VEHVIAKTIVVATLVRIIVLVITIIDVGIVRALHYPTCTSTPFQNNMNSP
jgi:hypothetical protein